MYFKTFESATDGKLNRAENWIGCKFDLNI